MVPSLLCPSGQFYVVPYGVTGVILAFIPGWLMDKAMLKIRGFFSAWFIYVCMDTYFETLVYHHLRVQAIQHF